VAAWSNCPLGSARSRPDSGAPAITQVLFDIEGEPKVRRIKQRAGVDMLVAPRRRVLDGLLAIAAGSGRPLRTV
jgi:hypothetical protein